MIWLSWRLQRTETLIALALLGLIVALLVPTGIKMADAYHADGLGACLSANPSGVCPQAIADFQLRFGRLGDLMAWFTLVPGLIGVMLAAPFLLELETGTVRLAWTQSITRRRWIAVKLLVPVVASLIVSAALILLMTWWRTPFVRLNGRMDSGTYDSEGIVALGYTLFALGLALAVGVIWRRAVPAVTVAFAGYVAARIFVDTWLRDRLVTPLHASWSSAGAPPASLFQADVISQTGIGPSIQTASGPGVFGLGHAEVARACVAGLGRHAQLVVVPGARRNLVGCSGPQHPVTLTALYQPESHFWPLQGVETALFAGTALALLLFAAWWTHRRVA